MADNVLQTLQQLVQDVIAPDVRELKVRIGSVEKQLENLEKQMERQYNALQKQSEAQYHSILAAIGESKAQAELINVRELARLSERLAILETQRH